MSDPLLVSQSEACRRLGVSRPTLIAEIKAGRLSYVRVGRRRKFKPGQLEAYIERQVQGWTGNDARRHDGARQRSTASRLRSREIGFDEALRITRRTSSRCL